MNLFDVYPLFDVEPVRGLGSRLWDQQGTEYLDLYGGHAVISIGHSHPHYVRRIQDQLQQLGFYSNSVQNPLQPILAEELGRQSGYEAHSLFLCNSGAEAMENALKLASFHTGRKQVVYLSGAFHGRTSAAVGITDNPRIQAPINLTDHLLKIAFNDLEALKRHLATEACCALVVEGIQGVGGIQVPNDAFLQAAREVCTQTGTVLILDEIQAGYGRTGRFFAHQHAGVAADLITVAKGMANGFPIGGVLIGPQFEAWYGMLGTTFGGNHLACAAGLAVLEVLEQENLIEQAARMGSYLMDALDDFAGITEVRGRGLMIGIELEQMAKPIRKQLLFEHQIFTGSSSRPNTLRLLPPLNLSQADADTFLEALQKVL
ncbi:MAG: aminotransferase class III-fold pyridoxal phosphate-dependent enzyme [Bacteroidota bacterium]